MLAVLKLDKISSEYKKLLPESGGYDVEGKTCMEESKVYVVI